MFRVRPSLHSPSTLRNQLAKPAIRQSGLVGSHPSHSDLLRSQQTCSERLESWATIENRMGSSVVFERFNVRYISTEPICSKRNFNRTRSHNLRTYHRSGHIPEDSPQQGTPQLFARVQERQGYGLPKPLNSHPLLRLRGSSHPRSYLFRRFAREPDFPEDNPRMDRNRRTGHPCLQISF